MIILYSEDTVNFNNLGEGAIKDAIECEVSEQINGTYELTMTYPMEGKRFNDIELGKIIGCPVSPYDSKHQHFRIYSISKPINGIITIDAQHISYDGSSVIISPDNINANDDFKYIKTTPTTEDIATWPSYKYYRKNENNKFIVAVKYIQGETYYTKVASNTIDYAIQMINQGRMLSDTSKLRYTLEKDSLFPSTNEETADFDITSPCSMRNAISKIVDPYKVELEFDDFKTTVFKQRGSDNGVTLSYGKNLEDLEETKTYKTKCDALYPYYWKTSQETSSGVTYDYQKLMIDANVPEFSYNWLYSESTSQGVVGKVKQLISSTLKSYIFRINSENTVTPQNNGLLYLWNTYKYIDVTDIDTWEMATVSADSEGNDNTSALKADIIGIISKLPVIGQLTAFIPSKEKMKCLQSLFTLYYSIYNSVKSGETPDDFLISFDVQNHKISITDKYGNNQNRTNIELYADPSYGYLDKTISGKTYSLAHAVFVYINNVRLYCGYQINSNLNLNNFLYVGPQDGTVQNGDSPIPFIDNASEPYEDWENDAFVTAEHMVYVNDSKETSYKGAIFIPRAKDNIDPEGETKQVWPVLYTALDENGNTKYQMYKEVPGESIDVDSSNVYTKNTWAKIATVKGLDPAYPSTGGEVTTKTQKAILSDLGIFYCEDAYTKNADIVAFEGALYGLKDSKVTHYEKIVLNTEKISNETVVNDGRLFKKEDDTTIYGYTFRNGDAKAWNTATKVLNPVEKLPTSDIDNDKMYRKTLKDGTIEHYIREKKDPNVADSKWQWVKLTNDVAKENYIYYTSLNDGEYYGEDDNDGISQIESSDIITVEVLPDELEEDKLYILNTQVSQNVKDSYKGCIFLNRESANKSNILVQTLDLTSLVDDKQSDLFTEDELAASSPQTAKKLLDFIKEYYIKEEDNDPNTSTNETTLSYMRIEENNDLIDKLNLYKVSIGDTIHINYSDMGIKNSMLRIKEITYDVIKNRFTDITLGELKEKLSSSVVTTSDGVSVLANDSGFTNSGDVNTLISKNIKASYVSTENFNATNATIDNIVAQMINTQQLQAVEAEIQVLKAAPLRGVASHTGGSSGEVDVVTKVEVGSFTDNTIRYETGMSVSWDNDDKILTITFNS